MYQTGRMPQLVKEFDNYNLDILGVSEVRWTGTGKEETGVRTYHCLLGKIR